MIDIIIVNGLLGYRRRTTEMNAEKEDRQKNKDRQKYWNCIIICYHYYNEIMELKRETK